MAGQKKQTRSPAQRKAIAARMREYHAKRRAAKAKGAAAGSRPAAASPLDALSAPPDLRKTREQLLVDNEKMEGMVQSLQRDTLDMGQEITRLANAGPSQAVVDLVHCVRLLLDRRYD